VRISNLFAAKQYSICEVITKGTACNMCIVLANFNVHCLQKHPEVPCTEKKAETYTFIACLLRRKSGGLRENNIITMGTDIFRRLEVKHEHDY
jgi:hypothetical protein